MVAEQNPAYAPAVTADTIQYKPLSLLAVAGFALASLFTLLLLAFAVDAFFRGQPFFLPSLVLLVPAAGAVLSGLGLWEIYNAEGTRAGSGLAKWGLAASLIVGVGYFTYQAVTVLAIVQQANRFVMEKDVDSGFFPRLQGSEVDLRTAFLFTLPPAERQNLRPENAQDMLQLEMPSEKMPKGPLTRFEESFLVRVIHQSPAATVKIEPGPVKDWTYENGSYRIARSYTIANDDGAWEVALNLHSAEPEAAGEKRKWRVEWLLGKPLPAISRTEQGKKKLVYRRKALEFLGGRESGLFPNLTRRAGLEVYLSEQSPQDRKDLRERAKALEALTPMVAIAGTSFPPLDLEQQETLRAAFLPGYVPIGKFGDTLDMDRLRFADKNQLNAIKQSVLDAFSLAKLPSLTWTLAEDELAPLEMKDGTVYVAAPFELLLRLAVGEKFYPIKVYGAITVATSSNIDPLAADPQWRVIGVALNRATPASAGGPEKRAGGI